jgi:uncharacterized protein
LPRRIEEDWKDFRDVFGGRIRKALKKFISTGNIFRTRGDGKKIRISIPRIEIPHIVFGDNPEGGGVGRGKGDKGKVIGKDDEKGKGNQAGDESADSIQISLDLEEVFKFMQDELKLPDLKPKPNQVYEEVKIKYNDISMTGPESLRHNRRTMLQALKRMAASGEIDKLHMIPGFADPVRLITPINSDRRYRQYKEIKIPSSNALIVYARDGSGSMDQYKCDIVSDMAWWIDLWIRRYYKRVESRYIWHDTVAKIVDQHEFYHERYGGGTVCTSALKKTLELIKSDGPFPPVKWNIYVLYFTDGENFGNDNELFNKIIASEFPPDSVNMVGITQVLAWNYADSLKATVDKFKHADNVRTTSVGNNDDKVMSNSMANAYYGTPTLSDEERNQQIMRAIIDLLGSPKKKASIDGAMLVETGGGKH